MSSFAVTPAGQAAREHPWSNDRKVALGMLFYVLTDVAFVIFLLVSYVWERAYNTKGGWFPFTHMRLPDQTVANLLVLLIVVSAIAFFVAQRAVRAGNQTMLRLALVVAVALVLIELVWQIRYLGEQQFATLDGTFASSWIMLNTYHVYHLLIGLFLGLGLTIRAFAGKYTSERHLGLITVGYYWYWMALMPVLVWAMILLFPARI